MENKTIYIHETETLWGENGEIYMHYNDGNVLVFNAEHLFIDLPCLLQLCLKEKKKSDDYVMSKLKQIEE